jgi:hypothetical protein
MAAKYTWDIYLNSTDEHISGVFEESETNTEEYKYSVFSAYLSSLIQDIEVGDEMSVYRVQ